VPSSDFGDMQVKHGPGRSDLPIGRKIIIKYGPIFYLPLLLEMSTKFLPQTLWRYVGQKWTTESVPEDLIYP